MDKARTMIQTSRRVWALSKFKESTTSRTCSRKRSLNRQAAR